MNAVVIPIEAIVLLRAKISRMVLATLVGLIVLMSSGNFSPGILSPDQSDLLQQAIVEVLWVLLLIPALFRTKSFRMKINGYTLVLIAFVTYAVMSSLWSGGGMEAYMKAAALGLNTFGVYVLISILKIDAIVDILICSLFLLISMSIVAVFFFPSIGVVDTWQHRGQWQGVFAQKQILGITASILLFCAAMRVRADRRVAWRTYHAVVIASAGACVLGSGSRGGGVLAVGAVVLSLLSTRSRSVRSVVGFVPLIAFGFAIAIMVHLYRTDLDFLSIGDFDIDFTQRTMIWKHAIDNVSLGSFLFGFGLNGFWTDPYIESSFLGHYGWFLDNYHDGYLYIFSECGVVGSFLFLLITFFISRKIRPALETSKENKRAMELMLGFVTLVYIINLTETFFLRSTNFVSLLFLGFLFYCFGEPHGDALWTSRVRQSRDRRNDTITASYRLNDPSGRLDAEGRLGAPTLSPLPSDVNATQ